MDHKQIGQFIAEKRKQKGMTQQQLADCLHLSNKTISKWETGEGLPDISSLPALAQALGVTVDALLEGGAPHAPAGDGGRALGEYLLQRRMRNYRLLVSVGLLLCALSVILFFTLWREWQNLFAVLFGACVWIAGLLPCCVGIIMAWPEAEAFYKQFGGPAPGVLLRNPLVKSVWLWLLFPFLAIDAAFPYYSLLRLLPLHYGPMGYGWHLICLLAYIALCILLQLRFKRGSKSPIN